MKILGIETSCDETAAAVVEDGPSTGSGLRILSNVVASSVEMHAKAGGIIPEVAAREQIRCIIPAIQEALRKTEDRKQKTVTSKTDDSNTVMPSSDNRSTVLPFYCPPEIDALAVTIGPGLIGSLLVGVETAKTLAFVWNKPIIPVNHLVAHIYANWLDTQKTEDRKQKTVNSKTVILSSDYRSAVPPFYRPPEFPAIALVVSGGHTDLVLMEDHPSRGRGKLRWLGGTRDDAAGECFDKCARILGLGYPGGPAISAEAEKLDPRRYSLAAKLPRPMIESKDFDFSFSGLKTAVVKEVNQLKTKKEFNHLTSQQLSFEIQESITDVLVEKTIRAAKKHKVKSIFLAGGVAANQRLREKFQSHPLITNYQLLIPLPRLCTDNAAYVASCAYFNFKPVPWEKIKVDPGLEIAQ